MLMKAAMAAARQVLWITFALLRFEEERVDFQAA
jgi:hypothetical protein